jgi:hypothetical protein
MQERIMRYKVERIRKIEIYSISLTLIIGQQESRNVTKLITVDLVLMEPC